MLCLYQIFEGSSKSLDSLLFLFSKSINLHLPSPFLLLFFSRSLALALCRYLLLRPSSERARDDQQASGPDPSRRVSLSLSLRRSLFLPLLSSPGGGVSTEVFLSLSSSSLRVIPVSTRL